MANIGGHTLERLVGGVVPSLTPCRGRPSSSGQLYLDGYSFKRHTVTAGSSYWRCKERKRLGCMAQVRTSIHDNQTKLHIIQSPLHKHNTQTKMRGRPPQLRKKRKKLWT